jgi:nicotinate dehydrogenase subunit A
MLQRPDRLVYRVFYRVFFIAAASEKSMKPVRLNVNGTAVDAFADPDTSLLDILRNHLGLMGTKFGCGLEQCGCCMVLVDGKPEKSCGKPLSAVAGKEIVTIEGLGTPERPHPLQQAFIDEQAGQCGYCLPGILISAKALLDRNASPSRKEIAEALDDNICRCGSHIRILRAVERAARLLRDGAAR